MPVDPRTPVIVGVGQFTERIDDPDDRGLSAVDLATAAVRAALADTGAAADDVAESIEVFVGLRQFEICTPFADPPLGASDNYLRSVARRIGADPARAVLEPIGGNGPQKVMTEFAGAIAAGDIEVALIVGSEPGSTAKYYSSRARASEATGEKFDKPDFTEHVGGQLEDRGYGFEQYMSEYTAGHGLDGRARAVRAARQRSPRPAGTRRRRVPPRDGRTVLAVLESCCEEPVLIVAGRTVGRRDRHRHRREQDDLRPVSAPAGGSRHREPGAAALVMSVAAARRLGVPQEKWVYLRGHADQTEQDLLDRHDVSVSISAKQAVAEALRIAGIGIDDVATFDLYSCFPFPVFAVCDEFGLAHDDPRGLTLTGGLPYFGGPGNSYSLHGIAETVAAIRDRPGSFGLVGANGGVMSKYSVGVYSTAPADWAPDRSRELQADIAALPKVAVTRNADGRGTIETYSVRYDWPDTTGIIIGRLDADGSRFMAVTTDTDLVAMMTEGDPLGAAIAVTNDGTTNVATLA